MLAEFSIEGHDESATVVDLLAALWQISKAGSQAYSAVMRCVRHSAARRIAEPCGAAERPRRFSRCPIRARSRETWRRDSEMPSQRMRSANSRTANSKSGLCRCSRARRLCVRRPVGRRWRKRQRQAVQNAVFCRRAKTVGGEAGDRSSRLTFVMRARSARPSRETRSRRAISRKCSRRLASIASSP